jgi:DNA-binding phage protein
MFTRADSATHPRVSKRNLCVTLHDVTRPTRTGAERYFAERAEQPGFAGAYDEARRRIDQIDRLVLALDKQRETMGITKAELARRADLAPEAIRRLFSADSPNPTIGTLAAIADALGLELVTRRRRIR